MGPTCRAPGDTPAHDSCSSIQSLNRKDVMGTTAVVFTLIYKIDKSHVFMFKMFAVRSVSNVKFDAIIIKKKEIINKVK